MALGRGRNRRKADGARRVAEAEAFIREHRHWGVVLLTAAISLAVAVAGARYGYQWVLTSPTFAVDTIRFHGLARATEPELRKLSGLSEGQNLWTLDVDALTRAMESHPWVRKVELTRRPPRAVVVNVEEHVPVALAALGDLYLVDDQGLPFKKVEPSDGVSLPLLTGVTREAYMRDPAGAIASFGRAVSVLRTYSDAGLAAADPLSELHLDPDETSLITEGGQTILLGNAPADAVMQRLAAVRKTLSHRGLVAATIHLDNRVRPGWVGVGLEGSLAERRGRTKSFARP